MGIRSATSIALCVALFALPISSVRGDGDTTEPFRAELIEFMDGLSGLTGFDEARIAEARRRVATMPAEELEELEATLSNFPAWKGLPRLASLLAEGEKLVVRLDAAKARLEELRSDLSERARDPNRRGRLDPAEADAFQAVVDEVQGIYDELNQGELAPLAEVMRTAGVDVPVTPMGGCSGGCGVNVACWIDYADCLIDQVGDLLDDIASFVSDALDEIAAIAIEIGQLATEVGDFFVGLFNDIVNAVDDLATFIADNFPTSPAAVESLLGLDDPQWLNDALASFPSIEPPCPEMGSQIPGIGEVGSARAEYVCKRGIDWFAHMLYDLAPDDVLDIPAKLIATGLYYPINYFCLCMESQSAISFSDAQAAHRALVETRLNAVLSTRASQASADTLLANLGNVDDDVAMARSRIALIDLKVDDLQVFQDDQADFLEAYQELLVRIDIEENLLSNPSGQVASFEFPEVFGGYLEGVRDIVDETIQANLAAGQQVFQAITRWEAGNIALAAGDYEGAFDEYRKAYKDAVKGGEEE